MSKAFTKEDAVEAPIVAPRAPLPPGVVNYVTPRGLALLTEELADLGRERERLDPNLEPAEHARRAAALGQRRAELEARIASATRVDPRAGDADTVRFGARVTLRGASGEDRAYRIVGVDEADASQRSIAFVSPLARALLGRKLGDSVVVRTPRGEDEVEILAIEYGDSP